MLGDRPCHAEERSQDWGHHHHPLAPGTRARGCPSAAHLHLAGQPQKAHCRPCLPSCTCPADRAVTWGGRGWGATRSHISGGRSYSGPQSQLGADPGQPINGLDTALPCQGSCLSLLRLLPTLLLACAVSQSYPILGNPVDGSLPGFSVRGINLARILRWLATSSSRTSSRPRDRTPVS